MRMNALVVLVCALAVAACDSPPGERIAAASSGTSSDLSSNDPRSGEQVSRARPPANGSPLDPLTADEINQVMAVLRGEHRISDAALVPQMKLQEPDKAFVLGWSPGQPQHRKAYVVSFTIEAFQKLDCLPFCAADLKARNEMEHTRARTCRSGRSRRGCC